MFIESMVKIEKARLSDSSAIKSLVDSAEEMDVIEETFPVSYFTRLIREGIVCVAKTKAKIVGVCFGKHNSKEGWADLLGLVVSPQYRGRGIGEKLVQTFERYVQNKKIRTIDLFASRETVEFFSTLGYRRGRSYIAFRKRFA